MTGQSTASNPRYTTVFGPDSQVSARVPSLDGWRAIAIAIVLISHTVFAGRVPFTNLGYGGLLFDGEFGVRIFFILSGFIITFLLAREAEFRDAVSLRQFYIRRALRILPIYLSYLLVLALLAWRGWYHDASSSWLGCLTFTRNLLGRGDSATIHFWTLAIEEQFYLLWPLAFVSGRLWRNEHRAFAIIIAILLLCPLVRMSMPATGGDLTSRLFGPRALTRYADSLAIGCSMAFMYRRSRTRFEFGLPARGWTALTLVVFAAQWVLHVGRWPILVVAAAPLLQGLAIGTLVLFSTSSSAGWIHRALNQRVVVRLGTLSYSLYVWHMLFLSGFMGPAWADLPTHFWLTWWLGALAVAALSYRHIERPFLALRRHFSVPAPSP